FESLLFSYLGGLAIGIGASVLTPHVGSGWTGRVPPSLPMLVLLAALLAMPRRGAAERRSGGRATSLGAPRLSPALVAGTGAVVAVLAATLPIHTGVGITIWTSWLVYSLLFASLGLLVRTSGQVSL